MKQINNIVKCAIGICIGIPIGVWVNPVIGVIAAGLVTFALVIAPSKQMGGEQL